MHVPVEYLASRHAALDDYVLRTLPIQWKDAAHEDLAFYEPVLVREDGRSGQWVCPESST